MISTAITRLFPLPNSRSRSASVDVNTETGYKFIDAAENAAQRLSALLVVDQQRTLGMRATRRPNDFGPRTGRRPPQDCPQPPIGVGLRVFGKILHR
jgi:hypothetical protein